MKTAIAIILPALIILAFLAAPAIELLITGNFTGSSNFYGQTEDSSAVNFILNFRSLFFTK